MKRVFSLLLLIGALTAHAYVVDCNDPRNRMDWQCQDKSDPEAEKDREERVNPVRTIKHVPGQADMVMEHNENPAQSEPAASDSATATKATAQDAEIAQAVDRVAQAVDRQTNVMIFITLLSLAASVISVIVVSN